MRLHQVEADKDDTAPKALACYGLLRADTGGMMLRFVSGRPASQVTEDFLGWVCQQLAGEGKKALQLIWNNASWHISGRVRGWIRAHNRLVKKEGGVRIISCPLPVNAPWLNRIEAKWVHDKRAIIEADRKLTGEEEIERVRNYYDREPLERLTQHVP